jgi:hypothetical protein
MPTTENYEWVTPTPGGSDGVWGGILNTAFDSIDSDLKTVEDKADAALLEAGGSALRVITGASGALVLDLSTHRQFRIATTGIASATLVNCPAGFCRVDVQVTKGSALWVVFFVAEGGSVLSPDGAAIPAYDSAKPAWFQLVTFDGGATWLLQLIGKSYAAS